MKNIAVLGTPKCGHAYLINLLFYIYKCKGVSEQAVGNFDASFPKNEITHIFNSHAFPTPNFVKSLQQNNFSIVSPIRNPHDQLFSMLLFYRRQEHKDLNALNYSLINDDSVEKDCLINNNVRDYVLSGKYEADYINSFLWKKIGGSLVIFEQLIRTPINTLQTLCDELNISSVNNRKILGAYHAASIDLLPDDQFNIHISKLATQLTRSYDWQPEFEKYAAAREVYNYLSKSDINIRYPKINDNFDIPHCPVIYEVGTPKALKRLFFISDFFLTSSNDQFAYNEFVRYVFSNVAKDDAVYVPGFAYEIWKSRYDLREAYPDPLNEDRTSFVRWIISQTYLEYEFPHSWCSKIYQSLM
jgi:hypothetical protein